MLLLKITNREGFKLIPQLFASKTLAVAISNAIGTIGYLAIAAGIMEIEISSQTSATTTRVRMDTKEGIGKATSCKDSPGPGRVSIGEIYISSVKVWLRWGRTHRGSDRIDLLLLNALPRLDSRGTGKTAGKARVFSLSGIQE